MSDGDKVLNNELNVKKNVNAMAAELKSLGIAFNESLIKLKKDQRGPSYCIVETKGL